jgi:anti-sigma regulatory factor (Ser/Thr protein kinase)
MLELRLPPRITAPATARSELRELPLGKSEREAVLVLARELVTNCVRHAGLGSRQTICLRAHVTDHAIRVEVIDSGTSVGIAMRPPDATGGWGLRLVDRIADRWGVIGDVGAHVWFELDRTNHPSGSAHRACGETRKERTSSAIVPCRRRERNMRTSLVCPPATRVVPNSSSAATSAAAPRVGASLRDEATTSRSDPMLGDTRQSRS